MRKMLAAAICAATLFVYSAPALAELATSIQNVVRNKDTAVALSSAAPSGNTDGYSVAPDANGYAAMSVWCGVDGGANNITGGNVRLWEKPNATEGWSRANSGDYLSIQSATVTPKWDGSPTKGAWGKGARIYCQLESITLSAGATVDKYTGIIWEKR